MNPLSKMLFSTRTMTVLLLLYGISMAVATFVENDFDTPTAKTLIYNASWFELLMLWLVVLFIRNISVYRLTRREKWPVLAFHLAFVFMFIGGAVTRYISFEGQMPIKEGQTTNEIISDLTYFKLHVSDGEKAMIYNKYPYQMSYFNGKITSWPFKRSFSQDFIFDKKTITLKVLDYIPLAKDSVVLTESGKRMIKLVSMGEQGRVNNYIAEGEIKSINGTLVGFNDTTEGIVRLVEKNGDIELTLPTDGEYMSMQGQMMGMITDTTKFSQNSGTLLANQASMVNHRALYTVGNGSFIIPEKPFNGVMKYFKGDKNNPSEKNLPGLIEVELSSGKDRDTVNLKGGQGILTLNNPVKLNGLDVSVGFGSKMLHTSFFLRCDDFKLDHYPGSNNPSSYESKITVIDGEKEKQHRIYMNNVMDYRGYRFFQASYFPDQSGTILSVNADRMGTNITYFGYFLLFAGMFFSLFWKDTHFWKLNESLKQMHTMKSVLVIVAMCVSSIGYGQNGVHDSTHVHQMSEHEANPTAQFARPDELGPDKRINPIHAEKFAHLLVQDFQGRIKPMNTHTLELLRKLYKKDHYKNAGLSLSSEQWFISMQVDPAFWATEPIIKVGSKGGDALLKETKANDEGYTSYANLLDPETGAFILEDKVNASFSKRKADQTNYDKEVIDVTERFNIFSNVAYGYYTKVVPVKDDLNNTWHSWIYSSDHNSVEIDDTAYVVLTNYFNSVKDGLKTGKWEKANENIDIMSKLQKTWGAKVVPADAKVNLEILYNHANAFFWLMIVYSMLGMCLVLLGFAEVLSTGTTYNKLIRVLTKVLLGFLVAALLVQAVTLGIRWYLSGHAPWSNGYEAIVFISGIGVLAGLILYKNRNAFIPAAGALVAMIMMGFAHGGSMLDPQITPLEPVLKSYWLMVHVGIITSSYGFFGLSAVLSVISLILYCVKPTDKIQHSIKEMTIVNEMSLTIGIFALTIGTFLGGMWANESWGRYWSWDPKETWAFISVIFYAVVLHLRLVPKLRGTLTFNIASLWAIWSVIFTYFGVNYYLSGLHSYAAGDPMPVPAWIYISATAMLVLTLSAYLRKKLTDKAQNFGQSA